MNLTDQQEMLSQNHKEEGRENEGATGDVNNPVTANLIETGELSIGSAHRRSGESVLSNKTSNSREGPAPIGKYVCNIALHNHCHF